MLTARIGFRMILDSVVSLFTSSCYEVISLFPLEKETDLVDSLKTKFAASHSLMISQISAAEPVIDAPLIHSPVSKTRPSATEIL